MSILEILAEAARHGVTIKLDGGRLALHAESKPPADLLDRIRENTAAIIRHFEEEPARVASDFPPSELFAGNVHKALLCHAEILNHPFDPDDFRMARVKADTATAVLNVAARGSPGELRLKQDASRVASAKLLAAVARADAMAEEDRRRDAEKAAMDAERPR